MGTFEPPIRFSVRKWPKQTNEQMDYYIVHNNRKQFEKSRKSVFEIFTATDRG